ncbi:hypothetical protein CRUP_032107 [Coryphaenoides rupestris]|nr:hypothetical protein CRUP_032107 [Coryphaenoides rupestris]
MEVAKAKLPKPTLTRYLRIRPVAWETGIALRFEVYGSPTAAPTTQAPSVAPADECEDGRPGCHGDTGDDYDPTGAPNTAPSLRRHPVTTCTAPTLLHPLPPPPLSPT